MNNEHSRQRCLTEEQWQTFRLMSENWNDVCDLALKWREHMNQTRQATIGDDRPAPNADEWETILLRQLAIQDVRERGC